MDLLKARSLDEALAFLEKRPGARILAGGTDLVIDLRKKRHSPEAMLDISQADGLKGITKDNGVWRIGPCTTYSELTHADLPKSLLGLSDSASQIGSPQIRNTATVGGNICNSSPAADIVPPLLALDARLTLSLRRNGETKERTVLLSEFFTGKGKNILMEGELLTGVEFDAPSKDACLTFEKLGLREALAISRICLAAYVEFDGESVALARIATGSLGETGTRELEIEPLLVGRSLTDETIAQAAKALSGSAQRRLEGRSTMPFKQEAVKGLLGHALRRAATRRNNQ